jgi:hypothetical protein
MVGIDPELVDPAHGDYRVRPGSPAEGYGCVTFAEKSAPIDPGTPLSEPYAARDIFRASGLPALGERVAVSGVIDVDTDWTADTIEVVGDVSIEDGVTLRIRPGVLVLFGGPQALTVRGRLLAVGRPDARIVFTGLASSRRPDPGSGPSTGPVRESWHGIRFPRTRATNDSTRIEWCIIDGASSDSGDERFGGALYFDGFSKAVVANTWIQGNHAAYGGAVFCYRHANPRFVSCLFSGNSADTTGAVVFAAYSYPKLLQCTIADNYNLMTETAWPTAAIVNYLSKTRTTGCVLWHNPTAYYFPGQILYSKPLYTTWNDVEGALEGEGNIDLAPGLAPDYRPPAGSPVIDAGEPVTEGLGLTPADLAGISRVMNGRVDIGAFEWLGVGAVEDGTGMDGGTAVARPAGFQFGPNPSGGEFVLRWRQETPGKLRLETFDVRGRRLGSVIDRAFAAGEQTIRLALDGLPEGVYFVRASGEGMTPVVWKAHRVAGSESAR